MNRIRLLPEHVANQIAAGEVVERPASVVKELVENALDAKPNRITVEIQAGGRSLVRVTDDGIGMSRDDALLCLERHATSKITRAEDLSAIATMGFRGEALPSIASISRFSLNTRERDGGIEGTEIIVNGGKIATVKAGGGAPGTSVEVRQLFFNLPARRKFLRSEETESAHIQHYLTLAALAYPAIAFEFIKDGRMLWQLPSVKAEDKIAALRERLRGLYGAEQKLLPVSFAGNLPVGAVDEESAAEESAVDPALHVWGLIGAPGVSRSTRDEQHVFVNRRPVENRGINFALLEGYHTALMKGRYPVCALFIELDASEVDVNIHPAKREVKFHHERAVRQIVTGAVRKALLDFHAPIPAPKLDPVISVAPTAPAPLKLEPQAPSTPEPEAIELPNFPKLSKPLPNWPAPKPIEPVAPLVTPQAIQLPVVNQPSLAPVPLLHVPLRLVGVIGKLYVILESDRGLVLLDQHAAHERILFEQMLQRLEQ
ncbi:MAG: DNA mismatch repair endonuclease MutL, partial [Limisphaerales bacterium]